MREERWSGGVGVVDQNWLRPKHGGGVGGGGIKMRTEGPHGAEGCGWCCEGGKREFLSLRIFKNYGRFCRPFKIAREQLLCGVLCEVKKRQMNL
ncbi:uncharacterized protein BDZ99DRAFT_298701 [Mytilinidion resinicola]|uniref:Uncharacterized protein n=1 Tax=Mytilinidion resinicola TaxID=574789 RepID=A0A6A6YQV1_9PEZI|nr:uncharacterized protein BDZ99DRAFT_298701 [Mytilinidion resinicola]KAF2811282.1 hypothetical protein BDZ99DRAFT_298701 [Mytilinidion resinicola]